jgi:hypothetical protein
LFEKAGLLSCAVSKLSFICVALSALQPFLTVMKKVLLIIISLILSACLYAQVAVVKMVGKNANQYKLGWGVFTYFDIPVNEVGNKSVRVELLDFAFLPSKNDNLYDTKGYLSIKLGYKNIFSETKTGFYIEPQAGYARIAEVNSYNGYGYDGVAAALEAGYTLEVGDRGHTLNLGLKYETDYAGKEHTINSVGLRFSYSFNLFRRRDY